MARRVVPCVYTERVAFKRASGWWLSVLLSPLVFPHHTRRRPATGVNLAVALSVLSALSAVSRLSALSASLIHLASYRTCRPHTHTGPRHARRREAGVGGCSPCKPSRSLQSLEHPGVKTPCVFESQTVSIFGCGKRLELPDDKLKLLPALAAAALGTRTCTGSRGWRAR